MPSVSARAARTAEPASSAPAPRRRPPVTTTEADTERPAGQVDDLDRQAVVESLGRNRRELVRAGCTGLRAFGHHRTVTNDVGRRGHAATSSSVEASSTSVSVERDVVGRARLGKIGQDHAVVGPEHGRRDLPDGLRRHREVARQHPIDEPGIVEQRRVHRQPVGALLDPLERAELVGLGQGLGTGQLVVAHELGRKPLQLLVERCLDTLDGNARPDGRPTGTHRRAADEPEREERDVLRDPLLADKPAVEPAALAARQDLTGKIEGIEPRVAEDGRSKADMDPRQRDTIGDDLTALAAERRRE